MKQIFKIIGYILLSVLLLSGLLFAYFNLPGPKPRQDVSFGITFSSRYATSLGLSWKDTYTALLDDMRVRKIRIPLYWDLIEKNKGAYDFSDIDWQLNEAQKRDAQIILVMGQKVPRWPECFAPEWASTDDIRRERLLAFEQRVIERYKNHLEVSMWQVENEPFLAFGNCPNFKISLLDEEVTLVKKLDTSRPVLTTDSGELSVWFHAAARGDQFGTTMYRDIWSKKFGYITYPIGPNFFLFKEMVVRLLTNQTHFMVIELQAEPWANGWIVDTPLSEQSRTMDEHKLVANIEYAKQVGFPEIYLWGAEWWYWMKVEKHSPAVWDTAKQYFSDGAALTKSTNVQ
jgi:hypothetical protein